MYVRRKKNKSGSISVQIISKTSGKYKVIKSFGSSTDPQAILGLELKAKQEAYDHDVARLMEEDESISQEVAATEAAITGSAKTIQELNARLDTITEAQKVNHGVAMIK